MRLPDPIANTTTEAYLAYKAGVLAEGDLKPKLYEPYIHLDAWLAYWTGLSFSYPVKGVGKNLFDKDKALDNYFYTSTGSKSTYSKLQFYNNKFYPKSNKITMSFSATHDKQSGSDIEANVRIVQYDESGNFISRLMSRTNGHTFTLDADTKSFILSVDNGPDAWFDDLQVEYGSTPTAYEPYTGEPEMLTDEEAYIAYLSGVTDTYPQEFRDPADIRVAAYLRYLISARFGRPEYPVTNEELYLSMLKTKYIPSGDPSSDIEIEGTAKAPFVDVKMYGDTFQQTYSGKNLFNREKYGTLVGWAAQGEIKNYGNRIFYIQCKPGTTYTIQKMLAKPVERSRCQIFTTSDVPAVGVSVIGVLFNTNDATQATVTTQSGANYLCVVCYEAVASTETTVQEMADSIMIEEGATATPYEPYVGGVPSPNPDYPQPIQTVTGRQMVNVTGKNLLDTFRFKNYSLTGVEVSIGADGSIILNGTSTASGNIRADVTDIFKGRVGEQLTYSIETSGTGLFSNFGLKTPNASISGNVTPTEPIKTVTLGESNTGNYIADVYFNGGKTFDNFVMKIQIEAGSTASDYATYSGQTHEINLGKNLFDKNNARIYALNPASNGSALSPLKNACSTFIPITGGDTFTVSTTNRALLDTYASVYFISGTPDTATTWITRTQFGQNSSVTVTAPARATYLGVYFLFSNNQTTIANAEATIQVERGSTASSYAAYFEPIELCKLGDYQDYIWKDGEEWKIHKETGYFDFSGQSSINGVNKQSATNLGGFVFGAFANPIPNYANPLIAYSNYFRVENTNRTWTEYGKMGVGSSGALWFKTIDDTHTDDRTVSQFVAWLRDTPVNLYYALATPTDTTITDQTLIAQLEALVNGGAEDGTTYIKVNATDPNLPGLLYVEAPKYE